MIAEGTFPVLAAGLSAWAVGWWGVSLARRDASVADPAWGPTFVLVGLLASIYDSIAEDGRKLRETSDAAASAEAEAADDAVDSDDNSDNE